MLRVHHHPRDPAVPVRERVHFRDQEHHEDGAAEPCGQVLVQGQALFQGPGHVRRRDEKGVPGPVGFFLEDPGVGFRPFLQQEAVPVLEQIFEFRVTARGFPHFLRIRYDLIGPQNVVRVFRPPRRDLSFEDQVHDGQGVVFAFNDNDLNRNPELEIRFWRTSTGQEVDFILGDREVALEIKGGTRVHEGDLSSLRALLHDQPVKKAIVVCRESLPRRLSSPVLEVMPWERFLSALWGGELEV